MYLLYLNSVLYEANKTQHSLFVIAAAPPTANNVSLAQALHAATLSMAKLDAHYSEAALNVLPHNPACHSSLEAYEKFFKATVIYECKYFPFTHVQQTRPT